MPECEQRGVSVSSFFRLLANPLLQASFPGQRVLSKENRAEQHLGNPLLFFIKAQDEGKVDFRNSIWARGKRDPGRGGETAAGPARARPRGRRQQQYNV